jgi:glycosyltransferase 2 family protein
VSSPAVQTVRPGTFAHPAAAALAAAIVLVVSATVARLDDIPSLELRLTVWINGAPEWLADVMYPVMQLGTPWAPVVVALIIGIANRDWLLAGATVLTGFVAWFAAKGVKEVFERGRPLRYLPEIVVREGYGTGLGFVSGHATVAAATAVLAMAALPPRWRPVAVVLAAIVGTARIVHGVHLPADVTGGWALGTLLGLGAVALVDRVRPERSTA